MNQDIGQQFIDTITGPLTGLGLDFSGSVEEVKLYAAQSMARLATLVGQPGYEMAVEAERDIVAWPSRPSATSSRSRSA